MKKNIFLFLATFIFSIASYAQSYQVIVNNANSTSSISKKDVSAYFLKKKTKWSDKTKVVPVDLSSKSAIRTSFSKEIHRKNTSQVRAFWQQSVFSGKATPPREMKTDAIAINYVKTHKGAIAYISASTKADGVKTVKIN